MLFLRNALALLFLFSLSACSTVDKRIERHQGVFDRLPADDQARVREGKVQLGDSAEVVYMAIGSPDRKYKRVTAEGEVNVWSYVRYEYRSRPHLVDGRFRYRDRNGRLRTGYESVWVDVEERNEYEVLRLEFKDGAVTALETVK